MTQKIKTSEHQIPTPQEFYLEYPLYKVVTIEEEFKSNLG